MIPCALWQAAFENFPVLKAKIGISVYSELKNIKNCLNLTVQSELEVELQVTGEPVTGELAVQKGEVPRVSFPVPSPSCLV